MSLRLRAGNAGLADHATGDLNGLRGRPCSLERLPAGLRNGPLSQPGREEKSLRGVRGSAPRISGFCWRARRPGARPLLVTNRMTLPGGEGE